MNIFTTTPVYIRWTIYLLILLPSSLPLSKIDDMPINTIAEFYWVMEMIVLAICRFTGGWLWCYGIFRWGQVEWMWLETAITGTSWSSSLSFQFGNRWLRINDTRRANKEGSFSSEFSEIMVTDLVASPCLYQYSLQRLTLAPLYYQDQIHTQHQDLRCECWRCLQSFWLRKSALVQE